MDDSSTEKKLLYAAVRVFYEKGYHLATIGEITREAGVSKGAIFHYFPTKSRILFSLMAGFMDTLGSGLDKCLKDVSGPVDKLKVFMRRHLIMCIENRLVAKVYLHEKKYLDPDDYSALEPLEDRYVNVCRDIIKEIQSRGLSKSELDPTTSLFALFGMCNWMYTWYDPNSRIVPEKLCDDFIEIYVNGLTQQTGAV